MYRKYSSFKKHSILTSALSILCFFAFGQTFGEVTVNKGFNMIPATPGSDYSFTISSSSGTVYTIGGKFFIAGSVLNNLNGNVGIGNPNPGQLGLIRLPHPLAKLHVNGNTISGGNTLISSDLTVANKWIGLPATSFAKWGLWVDKGVVATNYAITQAADWADYVFDSTYRLRPLHEVEKFIRENKHLPDVPSEQKIKNDGYTVHDMNARFLQKIEELTLYTIAQEKQIKLLQQRLEELENNTKKKNRKHHR